jgi:dihydrofolate reductase
MRKLILCLAVTIDGYIARRDGSVDYLKMPKGYSMTEFFARIDTAVMGRKTYEAGLKLGGGKIDSMGMKMYVFSKSLKPGQRAEVEIVSAASEKFIARLKKQKGKDIWLMGGGELNRTLLKFNLVDELHLDIQPILLGAGIPAFPSGFPQRDFALVESASYSQWLLTARYERKSKRARTVTSSRK